MFDASCFNCHSKHTQHSSTPTKMNAHPKPQPKFPKTKANTSMNKHGTPGFRSHLKATNT